MCSDIYFLSLNVGKLLINGILPKINSGFFFFIAYKY